MSRTWIVGAACVAMSLAAAPAVAEAAYAVRWYTVDCGGAAAAGGGYAVRGGIGQPDAAAASIQLGYRLEGGFWVAGATARPGGSVSGASLRLAKTEAGPLSLSWGLSCLPQDVDFAVYEGQLGAFASHLPAGAPACTTAGATSTSLAPATGDRYFLVVPLSDVREGSYGTDSDGLERPASATPCLPQWVGVCSGG